MKAILLSGGRKALSQLVSLIDKYRDVLREMGEADASQSAILEACLETIGHDMGVACIIIDVLIRRGVLKSIVLANYVFSKTNFDRLNSDIHIYTLAEISIDRSLDIVQAAVGKRRTLIGKGIAMESDSASSEPSIKDFSGSVTHIMSMGGGQDKTENTDTNEENAGEKRSHDDDDGNEDESERSSRRRKLDNDEEEQDAGADNAVAAEADAANTELASINEALNLAVQDCRIIYGKAISTLLQEISKKQADLLESAGSSEDGDSLAMLDPWVMSAFSLLRRILRPYHYAQFSMTQNGDDVQLLDDSTVQHNIEGFPLSSQLSLLWKAFSNDI